jgi:hypothetical protein
MSQPSRLLSAFGIYIAVIALLLGGLGVGLVTVVNGAAGLSQAPERDSSVLAQRVQDARDIRAALARPVPHPEPLPPITARPAHAVSAMTASRPARRVLSQQARDAFASDEPAPSRTQSYPTYDRHTSNY